MPQSPESSTVPTTWSSSSLIDQPSVMGSTWPGSSSVLDSSGAPSSRSSARGTGWSGMRTPTVLRRLLAAHRDAKDLLEIGAYAAGSNPLVDLAVERDAAITGFLRQEMHDPAPVEQSWAALRALVAR